MHVLFVALRWYRSMPTAWVKPYSIIIIDFSHQIILNMLLVKVTFIHRHFVQKIGSIFGSLQMFFLHMAWTRTSPLFSILFCVVSNWIKDDSLWVLGNCTTAILIFNIWRHPLFHTNQRTYPILLGNKTWIPMKTLELHWCHSTYGMRESLQCKWCHCPFYCIKTSTSAILLYL